MSGFVGALESEAGRGFVGVRGVSQRMSSAFRGCLACLGSSARQSPRPAGVLLALGFLGAPKPEAGRGNAIGVTGPSRKKTKN